MEREVSHKIRRRHSAPEGAQAARSFFWRSALVLFPILLLAGVGCWLLAKDRRLARHEADEIARDVSERVAEEIVRTLQAIEGEASPERFYSSSSNFSMWSYTLPIPSGVYVWRSRPDGALISPPPLQKFSSGIEEIRDGGAANLLFSEAEKAEFQSGDLRAAAILYDEAARRAFDNRLKYLAAYSAGRAYLALTNAPKARARFEMATGSEGYISELAQLKLLSVSSDGPSRDTLLSSLLERIICRPTALSGEILRQLEGPVDGKFSFPVPTRMIAAKALWNHFSTTRALAEALSAGKTGFVTLNNNSYLIVNWLTSTNEEKSFAAFEVQKLESRLETILKAPSSVRMPKYFAVSCDIAGLHVLPNQVPQGLSSSIANAAGLPVKVTAGLNNPAAYFATERERTAWFLVIIAIAAVVGIGGVLFIRQGIERLHRVNELKDNFVASVSHELRAPIASIRLLGESLERGKISDQARQQEYFHLIVQQCRRLGGLVENLLDFARQNRGQEIERDFQPINLFALVQENVAALEPLAREKGVALIIHPSSETGSELLAAATAIIEPGRRVGGPGLQAPVGRVPSRGAAPVTGCQIGEPPGILGDERALSQVIFNLVDNALKFSAAGGAIELTVMSDENHGVLAIRDHGPGIPPGEHQKIFNMFYRVGSELTRETAGVGIGLSLVKQIVELHQGGIYLKSAPGEGSCFIILIPKP